MTTAPSTDKAPPARSRNRVPKSPRSLAPPSPAYQLPDSRMVRAGTPVRQLLLDFPLYITARKLVDAATGEQRSVEESRQFVGPNGYCLRQLSEGAAARGLPSFFDYRVLWQLAAHLPRFASYTAASAGASPTQRQALRTVEVPSMRALLRELFGDPPRSVSGPRSARVQEALLRWKGMALCLPREALVSLPLRSGPRELAILEDVRFTEDARGCLKRVEVRFHEDFMHCLSTDSGYVVDVTTLSKFSSPTAARLWETLGVVFRKPVRGPGARRSVWRMSMAELMQRIGTHRERHLSATLAAAFAEMHAVDPSITYALEWTDGDDYEPVAVITCVRHAKSPNAAKIPH